MKVSLSFITLAAVVSLTACKPKPTQAQLRAMDEQAMAEWEKQNLDETMKATGPDRQRAGQKLASDREAEQSLNDGPNVTPAEAKLLDDYSRYPKETVDRLCDEVTKEGC